MTRLDKVTCVCGAEFTDAASFGSHNIQCDRQIKQDMKVSATGGLRDNKGKHRPSVVPTSLIKAVATVIHNSSTEGGGKYPMHNWRKGLPWTDVADSATRHIQDFLDRKDIDKESGLHTLYHAATNIAFLIEYLETCPQLDDRYKKDEK